MSTCTVCVCVCVGLGGDGAMSTMAVDILFV